MDVEGRAARAIHDEESAFDVLDAGEIERGHVVRLIVNPDAAGVHAGVGVERVQLACFSVGLTLVIFPAARVERRSRAFRRTAAGRAGAAVVRGRTRGIGGRDRDEGGDEEETHHRDAK